MNKYAAPAIEASLSGVLLTPVLELSSPVDPTANTSPLIATEVPKESPTGEFPVEFGFTYACWLQTPPFTVNTYTAPAEPAPSLGTLLTPELELASPGAPTATVSPLAATEVPKRSPDWVTPTAAGFR